MQCISDRFALLYSIFVRFLITFLIIYRTINKNTSL
nr:MAG TPA: hypothetical protein [Caudoviricetes sp.]